MAGEAGSGSRAFRLDDPAAVWRVETGSVDVFVAPLLGGEPGGPRRHLFRAGPGDALFGFSAAGAEGLGLVAVAGPAARVACLARASLEELGVVPASRVEVAAQVDGWVAAMSQAMRTGLPPRESAVRRTVAAPGGTQGRVAWVRSDEGGAGAADEPEPGPGAPDLFTPVSAYHWVESAEKQNFVVRSTDDLLADRSLWPSLTAFHQLARNCLALKAAQEDRSQRQQLGSRAEAEDAALARSFANLTTVLEERQPVGAFAPAEPESALLACCRLVGGALGIAIRSPRAVSAQTSPADLLNALARSSGIRIRRVMLQGDWWRRDNGPLVAFLGEQRRPVALLPASPGRYRLIDPEDGEPRPVGVEIAAQLAPYAHKFYRSFPARPLKLADLFRLGLQGGERDVVTILAMGLVVGLLAMVVPLATGVVFDAIIPGAERGRLMQLALVLLVSVVATSLFQLVRGLAMVRLEGRAGATVQAAVWDRVLSLPLPFFRQYTSGDLAQRSMAIDAIRQSLSSATVSALLSSVFAVFNFILLFVYDAGLALVATVMVLIATLVSTAIAYLKVRHERTLAASRGRLGGLVLQLLNGIAKFRVAGAEKRVFAYWAREFAALRLTTFRVRSLNNFLATFHAAFPALASVALYAMVGMGADTAVRTTGSFLGFFAAFSMVLAATLQLSAAGIASLNVVPHWERAKPIVEAVPEADEEKAFPGELSGDIEVSHVGFRYTEEGPLVLDDVSFRVRPGEFVALVGASGCGKSTLLRMLLGFERPASGALYYDRQDLATLDVREVRRQIGVVLQNGQLFAGDIFTNIVGCSELTVDDAWDAARSAGIAEDIEAMPMAMHTLVGEGGSGLSGGQRQRLLIARALARRPRILLFDEATSALDNRSQAVVIANLESRQVTRIVVAHRLSTIRHADRILVLAERRVVQSGSFAELAATPGPFAELAKRQME